MHEVVNLYSFNHVKEFTTKPTQDKLVVTRVICSTTGYIHKNKKEDTEIE